jgi:catechol 2,3-dioxygenase-like lactoylglutathione lyase family enzyme
VADTSVVDEATAPESLSGDRVGGPHISLMVQDTLQTARWWCRTLGFVLVERHDEPRAGRPWILLRHPDSGLVVGLRPRRGEPGHPPYLSLRVESRQALDDWAAHLRRLGVPHSAVRDNGDEQFLSLLGPDGIGLELWWPRPK